VCVEFSGKCLENLSLGTLLNRLESNSKFKLRSSRAKDPWNFDRCCSETSVRKYHYSLPNNPEEWSSHLLCGGSLNSPTIIEVFKDMFVIDRMARNFLNSRILLLAFFVFWHYAARYLDWYQINEQTDTNIKNIIK